MLVSHVLRLFEVPWKDRSLDPLVSPSPCLPVFAWPLELGPLNHGASLAPVLASATHSLRGDGTIRRFTGTRQSATIFPWAHRLGTVHSPRHIPYSPYQRYLPPAIAVSWSPSTSVPNSQTLSSFCLLSSFPLLRDPAKWKVLGNQTLPISLMQLRHSPTQLSSKADATLAKPRRSPLNLVHGHGS